MFSDRGAGEVDFVAVAGDFDEREVAGAAADVADENDLTVEEQLARLVEIAGDPGIEGRGGFFEQREARESGLFSGHDGEFAGFFVEGGGTVRTTCWSAMGP